MSQDQNSTDDALERLLVRVRELASAFPADHTVNLLDVLHWPGVMDFVLFHIDTASFSFRWYVFNLADVAIVAGVVGLLYESLWREGAVKAP